jgi:hypothetical protein
MTGLPRVRGAFAVGVAELSRVGGVTPGADRTEPYVLVAADGSAVEPVQAWVRELAVSDMGDDV